MTLKPFDIQRLEKVKGDIEKLQLRFPVTTIAEKMGIYKGTVSSFLSGRIPVSDDLLKKFYAAFGKELKESSVPQAKERQEVSSSQTELELLKSMDNKLAAILEALNRFVGPE